ncbi:MAG TPA: branched-chain amino acid transaminase [Acidimicrobiales bacterium]|nr:branched-chain amino acid transaminase [Acidimicrobiales bacterium]
MPVKPTSKVWMDGQLVDWEKATVHVLTHSLHYGTGAFEGIRCYPTADGPAIFRLREHMQRLVNSCKVLLIPLPYELHELVEAALEVVRANDASDGIYLRPLVYLGYGEMGVNPAPAPVNVAIVAWPWGAYLGEEGLARGVSLVTSTWRRHDPNSVPSVAKSTGGYVNAALAKLEAVNAGYDEALMLGTDGMVSEATGANVFVVRDGVVVTPSPSVAGALPGITQDSVIEIVRHLGYEVRFEPLLRTDLYLADEMFLTGTAAEVTPVRALDGRSIGASTPGPITSHVQSTFFEVVRGEVPQFRHWLQFP